MLCSILLCACGGGGLLGPVTPPTVQLLTPSTEQPATRGTTVAHLEIRYIDDGTGATTSLWAVDDGGNRTEIAVGRAHGAGNAQSVLWDPSGAASGRYRIVAETTAGADTAASTSSGAFHVIDPGSSALLGSATDSAHGVAGYEDGSYVVVGSFGLLDRRNPRIDTASLTLGEGEANETTFSSRLSHAFVGRHAADGTLLWARRTHGSGGDVAASGVAVVALDDGGCLVTGSFLLSVTFGRDEPNQTTLTSTSLEDVYVARYDRDGTLVWARKATGGDFGEWATAVVVFPDGDYAIAGHYSDEIEFADGTRFGATGLDVFVARFASDGTLRWARRASGVAGDLAHGLAARADGSCVLTGEGYGEFTVARGEPDARTFQIGNVNDLFVCSFAANGALEWARVLDATLAARGNATTTLGDGSAILVGLFTGTATFGNTLAITSAGAADILVVRISRDGTPIWLRGFGGAAGDNARAVQALPNGDLQVAGTFNGTAMFGSEQLTAQGGSDVLVLRLDDAGDVVWVRAAGTTGGDGGAAIATFSDGSAVFAGHASSSGMASGPNIFHGRLAADGTQ